jgi:hypothetical protein
VGGPTDGRDIVISDHYEAKNPDALPSSRTARGLVDEHKRERDQRIDRPCQAELSRRFASVEGSPFAPIGTPPIGNFFRDYQSDRTKFRRVPVRCCFTSPGENRRGIIEKLLLPGVNLVWVKLTFCWLFAPEPSDRPAGWHRANQCRSQIFCDPLMQLPLRACRGFELDQLAEASWVRPQAPRLDRVADWRQRRHVCGSSR